MQNSLSHWQDSSKSEPYAFRLATADAVVRFPRRYRQKAEKRPVM